jgi:hypothetical protein
VVSSTQWTQWTIKKILGILASNKGEWNVASNMGSSGFWHQTSERLWTQSPRWGEWKYIPRIMTYWISFTLLCVWVGSCRDHWFLPCGQCRKLAIGNWEWSWKKNRGCLANGYRCPHSPDEVLCLYQVSKWPVGFSPAFEISWSQRLPASDIVLFDVL